MPERFQIHISCLAWSGDTTSYSLVNKDAVVLEHYWLREDTVECRYNVVQYNIILHISLKVLRQDINQSLNEQNISHSSH